MKKFIVLIFLLSLSFGSANGQVLSKSSYKLLADPESGIKSNSVSDIVVADENTIWLGTGKGLSKTEDGGETWLTYSRKQGIGRGGVSAIAVQDSLIWVATAIDTLFDGEHYPAGGGLSYSLDYGATWNYVPQPQPGGDWTLVNNVSYDIAIIDSTVWIASFGGGLMKSSDLGQTWDVRPPDNYNFNPDEYYNHRVFALLAVGDTLWCGTAEGINVSYDAGETWETQFTHQNQDKPIAGNHVVAFCYQKTDEKQIVWAATANTEDPTEYRAVSKTEDGGLSWSTGLRGKFIYNFACEENTVYAATDSGLWKSPDYGETWDVFPQIMDSETHEKLYTIEYYSVGVTPAKTLWVGSADGLALSEDNGLNWSIYRSFVRPGTSGEPRVYAYPNPFSPLRHNQIGGDGFVRFQFNTTSNTSATIRIFDFAMDLVTTIEGGSFAANQDGVIPWNGKNADGDLLANGVYFYQLDLAGEGKYWGKVIIID